MLRQTLVSTQVGSVIVSLLPLVPIDSPWLKCAVFVVLFLCHTGEVDGIVTGPISKACWHQAGHIYPGQTELLAERSHTRDYGMMFVATSPFSDWQMRMLLATTHIPLAQVGKAKGLREVG